MTFKEFRIEIVNLVCPYVESSISIWCKCLKDAKNIEEMRKILLNEQFYFIATSNEDRIDLLDQIISKRDLQNLIDDLYKFNEDSSIDLIRKYGDLGEVIDHYKLLTFEDYVDYSYVVDGVKVDLLEIAG